MASFDPPFPANWGPDVLGEATWEWVPSAYGFGETTRRLLADMPRDGPASDELRSHLLSAVVHQNTLFPVAEPTARFLLPLCVSATALRDSLATFWAEWMTGIDMTRVEREVSSTELSSAVQTALGLDDDGLELLYEDTTEGSTIWVLHTFTLQRGAMIRGHVASLYM